MEKREIAESFSRLVLAVDDLRNAVLDEIPDLPKPAGVIARPEMLVVNKCSGKSRRVICSKTWERLASVRLPDGHLPIVTDDRTYVSDEFRFYATAGDPITGYEDD